MFLRIKSTSVFHTLSGRSHQVDPAAGVPPGILPRSLHVSIDYQSFFLVSVTNINIDRFFFFNYFLDLVLIAALDKIS